MMATLNCVVHVYLGNPNSWIVNCALDYREQKQTLERLGKRVRKIRNSTIFITSFLFRFYFVRILIVPNFPIHFFCLMYRKGTIKTVKHLDECWERQRKRKRKRKKPNNLVLVLILSFIIRQVNVTSPPIRPWLLNTFLLCV